MHGTNKRSGIKISFAEGGSLIFIKPVINLSFCENLLKTAELKILKVSNKEDIMTEELQVDDNEQSL